MTHPTRLIHTEALQFGISAAVIDACERFCPVLWSDVHKDAHGFRPRQALDCFTSEQLDALWDRTLEAQQESMREDARREAAAVAAWDELVDRTIALGAGDYATAVRWIMQAAGEVDLDYLLWEHGVTEFRNTRRIRELAGG